MGRQAITWLFPCRHGDSERRGLGIRLLRRGSVIAGGNGGDASGVGIIQASECLICGMVLDTIIGSPLSPFSSPLSGMGHVVTLSISCGGDDGVGASKDG